MKTISNWEEDILNITMKMQNELKSPKDGIIHRIRIKVGETVDQKQALLSVL